MATIFCLNFRIKTGAGGQANLLGCGRRGA